MTKDGLKLWQATKKSTNTIVKYWQGQGVKASNNEVKLSLYHGNNKVTLNSESQRTWHASTSFVSPQIVMGSMILQPTLNLFHNVTIFRLSEQGKAHVNKWNGTPQDKFHEEVCGLQCDQENCEHLKYLRNVYCVMTYHSKDQDMWTSHKTTNQLTSLLAVQFSHAWQAFFWNNSGVHGFRGLTVSLVSKTHPRIWILESVFEFWEVFWIPGSVFGFWEVFWILGSVLSLRATV